jgi:heat-inducible transcriptional repressor
VAGVKVDLGDRRVHSADELDARARQILRAVVQEYVETGAPVASQTLAQMPGMSLSAASVRTVLADLEALGYIDKPHTSAGRVPTDKGYRFYVDVLVRFRQVAKGEKELIDQQFDPQRVMSTPDVLVQDASRLLHTLTRYAGVVSTPREDESFRTVDFIRLRENRVLAVCVTGAGAVRNRLLTVDFPVDQDELDRASRYLHGLLANARTLHDVREALARELASDRATADALSARALALGTRAVAIDTMLATNQPSVVVEGETSLLAEATLGDDVGRVRAMVRALDEKQRLAALLERAAEAGELTLFIGEETGLAGTDRLALIATPYGRAGERLGAIGVVGPARMAYARVIPIVEYTARALSRTLDDG